MSAYNPQEIIHQLRHDENPSVRANAAFILGRDRSVIVVEPLIEALTDPDETVRVRVAEALGTRDEDRVVSPLIGTLQNDPSADVRRIAARSLGFIADQQALNPLMDALQDNEGSVRAAAAEALGTLQTDRAIDPLVHSFVHDSDANTRYFARQSLESMPGTATAAALATVLNETSDPEVATDIIEVLVQIQATEARSAIQRWAQHTHEAAQSTAQWALDLLRQQG